MAIRFINLGSTDNTFTVLDDNYVVTGSNGNNTLTFGQGNDQLALGNGNNTLTLGGGTDQVTAGSGNNTITTSGLGNDTIVLGGGNNTVSAGSGANVIRAGDGLNTVTAGNGNNTVVVGNGFDQVTTGNGNNSITAGNGAGDTIVVGTGSNTIAIGTGSADVVRTGSGNNTVSVAAAAVSTDSIQGGLTSGDGSRNRLVLTTAGIVNPAGVSGFEVYQLASGQSNSLTLNNANFARLPGGSITVLGGSAGNTVNASTLSAANAVIIHAGSGIDALTGGAGNDIFFGGLGNTAVNGGAGVNTMTYAGLRSSYSSTVSSGVVHVVGATNSDTLVNIQQLSFADGTVSVASLAVGPSTPAFTAASVITNNPTPVFAGKAETGSRLTLRSNGTVVGSAAADAATGAFRVTPNAPLALGLNTLSATTTTASGTSGATVPVSLFSLQAPVAGISTTDFSSADLSAVLSQGAKLAFISGTEAILLTDATLSVGPNTNQATIQRLYVGLLGRGGDTGGISTFDARLTAGASKADVASGLLNSSEYIAAHGTQTNDQLIATLYQGLLGRLPEAAAFASWNDQLAHGASRGSVAIGIADSNEAKSHLASTTTQVFVPNAGGTLVHELYETGLGREVELAALPGYKAAYAAITPAQIAAGIANSAEFIGHHTGQSNFAYVSSLYHDGLGRAPDAAGSAFWTTQLDSGNATRGGVLLSIATTGEAAAHLTHDLSV